MMRWSGRTDLIGGAVGVIVGILLSVLPHLLWWKALGGPVWIADHDDLLYAAYSSQAYYNHPFYLADPSQITGGTSGYPWLQFIPAVLLTKGLGGGAININLIWRIWAGASIALGWFLLGRHYLKDSRAATALTVVLLSDTGLIYAKPVLRQITLFVQIITGKPGGLFDTLPSLCFHWRIITPGLSLAFLLLHVWLVARAKEQPTWSRLVWSGIGFGLLFNVYFYYWTAAGLALLIALLLDPDSRKIYFQTGWIGGLIGLPSLISGFLLKRTTLPDWLQRSDKFLPISRLSELLIPTGAIILLIVCLLWVRYHRRDLIHLWSLAAAGILLANHQFLTGLQIENFHWLYVWGPSLSLLIILLVAGTLSGFLAHHRAWMRPAVCGIVVFCSLHLAAGVWLRVVEATQTREPREILETYQKYQAQRLKIATGKLAPNAVIAGEQGFVDLAVILENQRPLDHYAVVLSPAVSNAEWDTRISLNAYLQGLNHEAFEAEQRRVLESNHWGPWARDPEKLAERIKDRLAAYDAVASNPGEALTRFKVRYVALPASQAVPPSLDSGWQCLEQGPHWRVWERVSDFP